MSHQDEHGASAAAHSDPPDHPDDDLVSRRTRQLRIVTDYSSLAALHDFSDVSMMPTPLLNRSASDKFDDSVLPVAALSPLNSPVDGDGYDFDFGQQTSIPTALDAAAAAMTARRVPSGGMARPDHLFRSVSQRIYSASSSRSPSAEYGAGSASGAMPLHISNKNPPDTIVIPKRGEVRLARSGSMGTRRMPTTVLHRELAVPASGLPLRLGSIAQSQRQRFAITYGRDVPAVPDVPKLAEDPPNEPEPAIPLESDEPADEIEAIDKNGQHSTWLKMRFLGKGSFSEVALGVNKQDHSIVSAIKTMRVTGGDAQKQSIMRDAELLSDLPRHPALMHMLAYSLTPDAVTFVLPYCPGGDLFDLVAKYRTRMTSQLVRRIFADVCTAVAFLHSHNVVHRDIKLENVLLNIASPALFEISDPTTYSRPVAVLTDLGLARRIDPQNPLLTTRCGSEDYVPPELMLGQPYDGRQTDAWALGVLLYAILEGRLPFDPPPGRVESGPTASRARLRTAHRIARVDWAWYRRAECPPDWEGGKAIVQAALKRRQDRATAQELLSFPWVEHARPDEVQGLPGQ